MWCGAEWYLQACCVDHCLQACCADHRKKNWEGECGVGDPHVGWTYMGGLRSCCVLLHFVASARNTEWFGKERAFSRDFAARVSRGI